MFLALDRMESWENGRRTIGWLIKFAGWRSGCLTILLLISAAHAQQPEDRPKFGPEATRLRAEHAYLQTAPAPDYWRLAPYYVGQRDDRSCSLACMTMLANFARADRKLTATEPLATQDELFERVDNAAWRDGLAEAGAGVTLDQLAAIAGQVLSKYDVAAAKVQTRHVDKPSREELATLRELLAANEASASDLLLVNVLQSELTGDPEGAVGHFIPVAAYDARHDRVLLMDPDRRWYEPYWVSTATLLRAMATTDAESGKSRGTIHIQLPPEQR